MATTDDLSLALRQLLLAAEALPPISPDHSLPNRLPLRLDVWNQLLHALHITASPIPTWLSEGYLPPNFQPPQPFLYHNPSFTDEESSWLDEEIPRLVQHGVLRETLHPLGVHRISVRHQHSGMRMVTDCAYFNTSLTPAPQFAYSDLRVMATLVRPGDWISVQDIKKMFFHVPIHAQLQPWLCITWRNRFYAYCALPLGLQPSPWIIHTITRPICRALRLLGVTMILYCDDSATIAPSRHRCIQHVQLLRRLFTALGFLFNDTKSDGESASQRRAFLGFEICTTGTVVTASMLPHKRRALLNTTKELGRSVFVPAKRLAHFLGSLIATTRAFLPARAASRHLHHLLAQATRRLPWSIALVLLDRHAHQELSALRAALAHQLWTNRPLAPFSPGTPSHTLTTDASSEWGWAAVLSPHPPNVTPPLTIQDRWPLPDRLHVLPHLPSPCSLIEIAQDAITSRAALALAHRRSTVLELFPITSRPRASTAVWESSHHASLINSALLEGTAVILALLALRHHLRGHRLLLRVDNSVLYHTIRRAYSSNPTMNAIASSFWLLTDALRISWTGVQLLPSADNTADQPSRHWLPGRHRLEWPLAYSAFHRITSSFQCHPHIDAFASRHNALLPRYWSLLPDPLALAIDAIAQPWQGLSLWLNPPFALLNKVVNKIAVERPATSILLTPWWPGAPWWPTLTTLASAILPVHHQEILTGPGFALPEPLTNPRWHLVAWLLPSAL